MFATKREQFSTVMGSEGIEMGYQQQLVYYTPGTTCIKMGFVLSNIRI